MKEVAELAGVSAATVSRVLNESGLVSAHTTEPVRVAAHELGYMRSFAASGLASGWTRNVGVLVPAVDRWYFSALLEGITAALFEEGYDLTLYNSAGGLHHEGLLGDFLLRQRVDALIVVSARLRSDEIERLKAVGKPLVVVGGQLPGVPAIQIDDAGTARRATEHLTRLGHRKIAHIGGLDQGPVFSMSRFRGEGFQRAMDGGGLTVLPKWRVHSDFTTAGGYKAAVQLLTDGDDRRQRSSARPTKWRSEQFLLPGTWGSRYRRIYPSSE